MNASGTADFVFDNDNVTNSIQMSTEDATAFAGERIDIAGASTVNSLSIYNVNSAGTTVKIAGFGALGTLINNEPSYEEDVVLYSTGWNTIYVDWQFTGIEESGNNIYFEGEEPGFSDTEVQGFLINFNQHILVKAMLIVANIILYLGVFFILCVYVYLI